MNLVRPSEFVTDVRERLQKSAGSGDLGDPHCTTLRRLSLAQVLSLSPSLACTTFFARNTSQGLCFQYGSLFSAQNPGFDPTALIVTKQHLARQAALKRLSNARHELLLGAPHRH